MECFVILSLILLCVINSKAQGSNGCPESRNVTIRNSYKTVSWDTTWSDFQSKNCTWRLNLQPSGTMNFTIRLEKLFLSSHDTYVYSQMGIVKTRVVDKLLVSVCGYKNQLQLPMSAVGEEYQFTGMALCFVSPQVNYNYGQNIFTTHRLIMRIGVKLTVPQRDNVISIYPLRYTTPGIHSSSVPDILSKTTSGTENYPIFSLSSPVRLRSDTTYISRTAELTSPQTISNSLETSPDLPLLHHQTPPLSKHQSTSSPLSKHQSTSSPLSKHQSTSSSVSKHQSTRSSLTKHQSTSSQQFNHQSTSSTLSNHQSTGFTLSKHQSTSSILSNHQSTSPALSFYQSPNSLLSSNHEIVATEVSTQFTHNPSSQSKIVTMTTPWTLIIRTTETTVVYGARTTDHSEHPTSGTTSSGILPPAEDQKTSLYLLVGVVSVAAPLLLAVVFIVIYKVRSRGRDIDANIPSMDYGQPWSWRKNWVIKRTFNEMETEGAKKDLQIKPSLPYRPSYKQHSPVSRLSDMTTCLNEEDEGAYDNIIAMTTRDFIAAMKISGTEQLQKHSCEMASDENKSSTNNSAPVYSKADRT